LPVSRRPLLFENQKRDVMPFLFSYGTLQHESVQLATFGRRLYGQPDELVGFEPSRSGHHANATFNGRRESRVSGVVFEISDAELAAADAYERHAGYIRILAPVASGRQVWVYIDGHPANPAP
jgi:hypothetical protein